MKKICFWGLCVIALLSTVLSANSLELVKPEGGFKNTVSSTIKANVNDNSKSNMQRKIREINDESDKITESFNASLTSVAEALFTKEQKEALKAKQEQLSKDSKTKEKGAVESALLEDVTVMLTSQEQAQEMAERAKSLNEEQKAQLAKSIEQLGCAGNGYLDILSDANDLFAQISADPVTAMTMGSDLKLLKKVMTNLPKQAKATGSITAGLFKIATNAGIKVTKTNNSGSKAKKVDF